MSDESSAGEAPGILPCQSIEALIAQEAITSATPFDLDQVQPASLDLRLGSTPTASAPPSCRAAAVR